MKQDDQQQQEMKTRLSTLNIYLGGITIIVLILIGGILLFLIIAPALMTTMSDCSIGIFDKSKCGTIGGIFLIFYIPIFFLQLFVVLIGISEGNEPRKNAFICYNIISTIFLVYIIVTFTYIPFSASSCIYGFTYVNLGLTILWGIVSIVRKIRDMVEEMETLESELNTITVK